jgi:hypothetical protein
MYLVLPVEFGAVKHDTSLEIKQVFHLLLGFRLDKIRNHNLIPDRNKDI